MKLLYSILLFCLLVMAACRKTLLNEKPLSGLVVPSTQEDLLSLLDNENVMERSPVLGEGSSDDYYFASDYWRSRSLIERNTYTWSRDIYNGGGDIYDWNIPYKQVLSCNIVLEGLNNLSGKIPAREWNELKANALFKRAFAFYNLAQVFAPPYDVQTALSAGIPLRLNADINIPTTRATIGQTYDQITGDLRLAAALYEKTGPDIFKNRPGKAACYAMLSRVYLSMRQYELCGRFADSSLDLYDTLIDYNSVGLSTNTPFTVQNIENIYTAKVPNTEFQSILPSAGQANMDTVLFRSYADNDLRKRIFFNVSSGYPRRKNFYDGSSATLYTGLAVDELYLNKAECLALAGKTSDAMDMLNRLLVKRFVSGTYEKLSAADPVSARDIILTERRKELVMRCLRWTDLRRLNIEGRNITLIRIVDGNIYTLPPNSPLYVLPIPPDVIALTGIPQNPR